MPDTTTGEKKTKAKILVVDDDPEITESFGLVLKDSGLYQFVKHTDPNVVLSDLKPGDYDLVLLDIKMPDVDSFELHDKIKRINSNLKVCFIGTYDNEESYKALRNEFPLLEADCFMSKEVTIKDLIRRINTQLESQ
ncbi:MAG TPA: response regulator [Nitrososphaeraceae archaeon]|nr:response regulator [Nitrososphaeraceae archaeon]